MSVFTKKPFMVGIYIKHARENVSRFKDLELDRTDFNHPICGLDNIDRRKIYSVLRTKYEDKFGQLFLSKEDYENKNSFGWIALIEGQIEALTNITAFMLSDKKPIGVGSMSHNRTQDKTLSTILAYPKKNIVITKAAHFAYPNIKDDIKEMKEIFKRSRHSMEFGEKKGAIVQKLRKLSSSQKDVLVIVVKAIDKLREFPVTQKSSNKELFDLICNKRWTSAYSPIKGLEYLYKPDPALNEFLRSDESNELFGILKEQCKYELNSIILNSLKEAFDHVELQLNLKIKKPIPEIERLTTKTIDIVELNENGNYKIIDYFSNRPSSIVKKDGNYTDSPTILLLSFGKSAQA